MVLCHRYIKCRFYPGSTLISPVIIIQITLFLVFHLDRPCLTLFTKGTYTFWKCWKLDLHLGSFKLKGVLLNYELKMRQGDCETFEKDLQEFKKVTFGDESYREGRSGLL